MTRFEDLPNELLSYIIAILGEPTAPYGYRKHLSPLLSLCLTSKRLCDLARLNLYSAASFDKCSDLETYFCESGINKVPPGTLRKILVSPGMDRSFASLLTFDEVREGDEEAGEDSEGITMEQILAKHTTAVDYLAIFTKWEFENFDDNDPDFYSPLLKAVNLISVIYESGLSPTDIRCRGGGDPSVPADFLLDAIHTYSRLTYLSMPMLDFHALSKDDLGVLFRLPLEYLRFDWPSTLTADLIYELLVGLPKLRKNGLVISCQQSQYAVEMFRGDDDDDDRFDLTERAFLRNNNNLSLPEMEAYLRSKQRTDLLEKLLWHGPHEKVYDENDDLVDYIPYEPDWKLEEVRKEHLYA